MNQEWISIGDVEFSLSRGTNVMFQIDENTRIKIKKPNHKKDCNYEVWLYTHGCEYRYLTNDFNEWVEHVRLVLRDQASFADEASLRRTPEAGME